MLNYWHGWIPRESGSKSYRSMGDRGRAWGAYQFDYRYALLDFLDYCQSESPHFGAFSSFTEKYGKGDPALVGNQNLYSIWQNYCNQYWDEFTGLQDEFAYGKYFEPTYNHLISDRGIDLANRSEALRGSVFSFAIRSGEGECVTKHLSSTTGMMAECNNNMTDEQIMRKAYAFYGSSDAGRWPEQLADALAYLAKEKGGTEVTYYISNCGGDERGQLHGGQAGDQSGTEWAVKPISAYHSTWTHVFRYPDADVRKTIADIAVEAANNNLVGYDQDERTTFYDHLKASNWRPSQITVACEADCSAGVAACVIAAGHLTGVNALASISPDMYTGNEIDTLTAAGFRQVPEAVDDPSKALRGDIYLNLGHHTAIFVGTNADGSENTKGGNRIMFEFSTVKPGDKGVDVLLLQEILKSRVNGDTGKPFYEGPLDQIYDIGMGLEAGVNAYQDQREKDGVHIGTNGSHDSICGRAMWQDLLGKASV